MVIRIRDLVSGANTSEEGTMVFERLRKELSSGDTSVVVSFQEIRTATPSFVNAAFVGLLNEFTLPEIKMRLKVTESTRQINDMIKARLSRTSGVAA